jgi:uncharacterized protein YqjF (DUF2071 family)
MKMNPVSAAPVPAGPIVMRQRWQELLFLHWRCDPAVVQATLPPGLTVDVYEDDAYLGLVPFFMRDVRPTGLPAVPWLSNFLELNVRTYVRDENGDPGVWFYSLDCDQPVAVMVARAFFRLPYFHARMHADFAGEGTEVHYHCRRRGTEVDAPFIYRSAGPTAPSQADSLEAFLVERYRLFAWKSGRLFSGRVWHQPYQIGPVEVAEFSTLPLLQAGFDFGDRPPDHALYAPGVDVQIYPLRAIAGS